jgi:hypothetical protein
MAKAYGVEVELPGEVLRIRAADFKKHFERLQSIHSMLFRYTYTALVQLAQSSACGRFHPIESRLSRWLLMAHDRASSDELMLTQQILAGMIGARRPTVSIVGGMLQKAGLIRISRGRVTILDRPRLEEASCECYGVIRDAFDRFLGSDAPGVGRGSRAPRSPRGFRRDKASPSPALEKSESAEIRIPAAASPDPPRALPRP